MGSLLSASLQIHENLGQQLFLLYMHGLEWCTVCQNLKKVQRILFYNSERDWTTTTIEFGLISSPGIKETELAPEKFRKSSAYFSLALSLRKMFSVGHIWGHEDHMWQLVWGHQPDDNITSCKNSSGMYDSVIFNFMSVVHI